MNRRNDRIPFVDLGAIHGDLTDAILRAWRDEIAASRFVGGPAVAAFEQAFAAYVGVAECVGLASGTDALHLALLALGVGPGDEVVTVPHTFVATVEAITRTGARPVFADVDRATGTLDPAAFAAAVTPRTRAVVPVHLYGQVADMAAIGAIAARHGVRVIEDAAQAHGARRDGTPAGAFGDAAAFSFYPSKNLGALGEGGAVVTNDGALAGRVRLMRDHGQARKNEHVVEGWTARLHALQAVALSIKLPHLDAWNAERRAVARRYAEALRATALELPVEQPGCEHVWHLYVVRHPERDRIRRALDAAGIDTGLHYPVPVHRQPAYAALGLQAGSFPEAERWAARCLSLPMYPGLTAAGIARVADAVHGAA